MHAGHRDSTFIDHVFAYVCDKWILCVYIQPYKNSMKLIIVIDEHNIIRFTYIAVMIRSETGLPYHDHASTCKSYALIK